MNTSGNWASARADATSTSTSLLGIALGTDPDVNGAIMGEYPYSDNGDDNGDVDPSLLSDIDQNSNTSETEDE